MNEDMTPEELSELDSLSKKKMAPPPSSYVWDIEFQRDILGALMKDRAFLIESMPVVNPRYFSDEAHQVICAVLFGYFDEFKVQPSENEIVQEVKDKLKEQSDEKKSRILIELSQILNFTAGNDSRDNYKKKILNFAKSQALKDSFYKSLEELKKAPDLESTWSKIDHYLRDALNVNMNFDQGLDYFNTLEERYARKKESIDKGEVFTSGFEAIDSALKNGGLLRGEMGSWIGLSGSGKSLSLVVAAIANLMKGKKVLYITLEIAQDAVAERFDAQLADPDKNKGITVNNLLEKKDIVISSLHEMMEPYLDKKMMLVKQFPGGQMGIPEFRAYFAQIVQHGFRPDLVIIDYLGEMKDYPGIPTHESRYRITRDLRGFAVEEQVGMLTAMQPNKSAKEVVRNGLLIDDEQLGDSYAQIKPLDAMWSLNQLQDEKDCGLGRVFVAKHREGKSRFVFYVEFDYKTLSIKQISEEKYNNIRRNYNLTKEKTTSDQIREEMMGTNLEAALSKKKKISFSESTTEETTPEDLEKILGKE